MENKKLKAIVIIGLLWRVGEQFGTQIIQFVTQLVLARILMPGDYGVISIITVFITISQVFVDSGFGQALVQNKKIDNVDLSSVFFANLAVALMAYIIIFASAPIIAGFYKEPIIKYVLRAQGIVIIINALNVVQNSVMIRNMQFKKSFMGSGIGTLTQGIVGIILAVMNLGVWALTFSQIARSIVITIVLWKTVKWKFQFNFSAKRMRELFKYGSGILISNLVNTIFVNLQTLIVGKKFNSENLGFYTRGEQFPQLVSNNITMPLSAVLFPTMTKLQDNRKELKNVMQRIIVMGSYFTFPLMTILAIVAKPIVLLLLTEKWLPCVPFLQLACIKFAFSPIHDANLQAITAIGKSVIFMKLSIVKNVITLMILFISINFGIFAVAVGGVVASLLSIFIDIAPNIKIISYSLKDQLHDLLPNMILAGLVGLITYSIGYIGLSEYLTGFLQIGTYGLLYIVFSKMLRMKGLNESLKILVELRIIIAKKSVTT